jgi:hypothetical protein
LNEKEKEKEIQLEVYGVSGQESSRMSGGKIQRLKYGVSGLGLGLGKARRGGNPTAALWSFKSGVESRVRRGKNSKSNY